jgi:hypothetical protein
MGDEHKYADRTNLNAQSEHSNNTSLSPLKPLTQVEEDRIRETKKIIEECFPELLPEIKVFIDLGMISGLRDVRAYRLKPAPVKKIITHVVRDSIHPINGQAGFDVLTITATSSEQLNKAIKSAELKHWYACPISDDIVDNQHLTITMYKPTHYEVLHIKSAPSKV